ncbi:MAG: YifB family Mg chelatase-like AAA ATPase [Bacteroidales bacterium]|nr:YifB family Mg chelatase-like AAA ATPase [Bacteroidales bacterium]
MLVKTYGAAVSGIDALTVTMEVDVCAGVRFFIVGLPDNAVKESEHRIDAAMRVSGWNWPGKQIVINMAPADIRKEGSAYDLPLAIGIIAGNEQISNESLHKYLIMGELSLDGSLVPIKGALPMAMMAKNEGFEGCIFPSENAKEAAIVDGIKIYGAENLKQVAEFLDKGTGMEPVEIDIDEEFRKATGMSDFDFAEVKGQENVKRALEIAAAGGHNILMIGSPGSGKSMMAKRMPSILPPLTMEEALETTKIHSVAGKIKGDTSLLTRRPFRSPHHTISDVALVGGGTYPQPGEISLAHNGVLFLDELPEFKRTVLEVMRQPLEDRTISISRSRFTVEYPASFMLVASMNPCPCGYYNDPARACTCPPGLVKKYLGRISGPLLDRIDLHVEVVPVPFDKLADAPASESSAVIKARVVKAREIQSRRYADYPGIHCNAQMTPKMQAKFSQPDEAGQQILKMAMSKLGLSARAYDRILKVARTIADLEGMESIQASHIAEAIQYRSLDRETWGE